jgi:hypothetical protein
VRDEAAPTVMVVDEDCGAHAAVMAMSAPMTAPALSARRAFTSLGPRSRHWLP